MTLTKMTPTPRPNTELSQRDVLSLLRGDSGTNFSNKVADVSFYKGD